jgi:hypothetical protein
MIQRIAKILCLTLLIVIFGCAGQQLNTLPESEGVGYSWWEEAPSWMAKDFIYGNFGLMDGFKFEFNMTTHYALKVDQPSDPEGIDGQCDIVVILVKTEMTSVREQGYEGPLLRVVNQLDCDIWGEMKKDILKQTDI